MLLFGVIPTEPWDILFTQSFWLFIIFILILIVVERVIAWAARRSVTRLGLPRSAANNVLIVVRIIIIVIAITAAMPLLGVFIPSELIVALTASFATAIALFISFSLNNVVAGIYILVTRPFAVGDYVRIGGTEGIVEELTINFTRVYGPDKVFVTLPNNRVLGSDITNYRVRELLYKTTEAEEKKSKAKKEKGGLLARRRMEKLEKSLKVEKLYRYTFTVNVKGDKYNEDKTISKFEELNDKWKPKFGYKLSYEHWGAGTGDVPFLFAITVEDPYKLVEYRNEFYKDLLAVIRSL